MKRKIKIAIFQTITAFVLDYVFDEDDEMYEVLNMIKKQNVFKRRRVCIENYEYVILRYSMEDFKSHFRLERRTIQIILEQMGNKIYQATSLGGRPSSPQKQLLLAIWMLANQEVYRSVADRFNVSLSTAWEYFQRIISVLVQLSPNYIKWPEVYDNVMKGFKKRGGIDGVVGTINGTHISIAGCPGSVHDARVYRMPPLYRQIMPGINEEYHLLGDSAYPNSVNLLTPYRDNGHLTQQQKIFNYLHSATRVHIEQSFELLKGIFRILKFVNVYRTEMIPNIIIACCVLHNICMNNKDEDIESYLDDSDNGQITDQILPDEPASCSKRDNICKQILT